MVTDEYVFIPLGGSHWEPSGEVLVGGDELIFVYYDVGDLVIFCVGCGRFCKLILECCFRCQSR